MNPAPGPLHPGLPMPPAAVDPLTEAKRQLESVVRDAKGRPWEDAAFPPQPCSLCHDWNALRRNAHQWRALTWWRAERLAVVPSGGIHPNDIKQGILGDCYFLAALSALANRHKELVERLIVTNPDALRLGFSICQLSNGGRWMNLPVSHTFPCHPQGGFAFSQAQRHSLWVPLLEKAWAKLHGSYQAIEAGVASEALRALTGAPSRNHRLDDARRIRTDSWVQTPSGILDAGTYSPASGVVTNDAAGDTTEGVWKALTDVAKRGFPACASCGDFGEQERLDPATGLVRGHAYSMLDAKTVKNVPSVLLRNPWGRGLWRGALDMGDGQFWMPYADFVQQFSTVDVCRARPGHSSECIDVAPPGGPLSLVSARLEVQRAGTVSLSVLQASGRGRPEPPERNSVGIEVFDSKSVRLGSSPYYSREEVCIDLDVKPGTYTAVVRSSGAARFRLCSYAAAPVNLQSRLGDSEERRAAYEMLVRKHGEKLFSENGASVRLWTSENRETFVLLFDAGPSPLLACIHWSLKNLLLQTHFPREADDGDRSRAAWSLSKKQVVDLQPRQQQMTVLSWVDSQNPHSMQYKWTAAVKPCSVCGAPVGCQVPGRFSGEYLQMSHPLMGQGPLVHKECATGGFAGDPGPSSTASVFKRMLLKW